METVKACQEYFSFELLPSIRLGKCKKIFEKNYDQRNALCYVTLFISLFVFLHFTFILLFTVYTYL